MRPYRSLNLMRPVTSEDLRKLTLVELGKLYCELSREEDPPGFEDEEEGVGAVFPLLEEAITVVNDESVNESRRPVALPQTCFPPTSGYGSPTRSLLIELLSREGGSTLGECMVATRLARNKCLSQIRKLHECYGYGIEEGPDHRIWLVAG